MRIKNFLPIASRAARSDDDHPFYALQRQMNSLFDDFFSGVDAAPRSLTAGGGGSFLPSVDVKESDKDYVIRAELPGVDELDIDVTVSADGVTIKGEKKEEKEDKGKNYYYMERSYGSFERFIPLAVEAGEDKARASFKNGVLNITVAKSAASQSRATKILIKSS